MVKQSSRCADDELRPAPQFLLLSLDVRTTVDDDRSDTKLRAQGLRHTRDLDGKLARGRNDERLCCRSLRLDLRKQRQEEGNGLARARLCLR